MFLNKLLEDFILPEESSQQEILAIKEIVDGLAKTQKLVEYDRAVAFAIVRKHIEDELEKKSGQGFMSTGVTFCAMLPMRSIPFKVIGLVGMNTDSFPRSTRSPGFDLMAKNPRRGDRSRRNDDKYLFLEALVSARSRFYISYVGRRIHDNSPIPPSVLVSEVIDYLQERFDVEKEQLVTEHRLQAFADDYFNDQTDLFTYSVENLKAYTELYRARMGRFAQEGFVSAPLDIAADDIARWKRIDPGALASFFLNPCRYFLQRRLGIYLEQTRPVMAEKENFALNSLDSYRLDQELLSLKLKGLSLDDKLPLFRNQGFLPHGTLGELAYRQAVLEVESFFKQNRHYVCENGRKDITVDLTVDDFVITGQLAGVHKDGLLRLEYVDMKTKYIIKTWIYHLIYNAVHGESAPPRSILLCKDASVQFNPVSDAVGILSDLLKQYLQGLLEPMPFFPESSYEYARNRVDRGMDARMALKRAMAKWSGYIYGESQDPYFDLCFGHLEPTDIFDDRFEKLSRTILEPLFINLRKD